MLTGAILYLTLGTPVDDVESIAVAGEICAPVPPEPRRLDVTIFDAGESRYRGAEAIYELSTGDVGEGSVMFDGDGNGEGYFAINGVMVSHVAITFDPASGQPVTTIWWPEQLGHSPELIAELMGADLPSLVVDSLPAEFKCSRFGKKVLKAGKYMWGGLMAASAAACCAASQGVACVVCAAGAWAGAEAGGEFADGYCD